MRSCRCHTGAPRSPNGHKIEKCAGQGGLAVGDACWRSLHTSWR